VYTTPDDHPGTERATMSHTLTPEPTVGEIARRTNRPIHKIEYVIRSRGIKPARIAGNCRIFAEEDVQRIAKELDAIDAARQESARA
jgi:hypothetical protein